MTSILIKRHTERKKRETVKGMGRDESYTKLGAPVDMGGGERVRGTQP